MFPPLFVLWASPPTIFRHLGSSVSFTGNVPGLRSLLAHKFERAVRKRPGHIFARYI